MANNANYGFESRWAVYPAGTAFDSSAPRFDFTGSTVSGASSILDGAGLTGSRDLREDRTRWGLKIVRGQIMLEPSPQNLHFFWKYILGAQSSNNFTVLDALPGFDLLADDFGSGSSAILFGELYVDTATIQFAPGILKMQLDVIGKTYTPGQSYTSAALGAGSGHTGYTFDDTVFTLKSSAREVERGTFTLRNLLDAKHRNSRTATSIRATGRQVSLELDIPNTASNLSAFFGDKAAADATIVMTQGSLSSTLNLNNLKNPDDSPVVNGKDEIMLKLGNTARADSSDASISVVNVAA